MHVSQQCFVSIVVTITMTFDSQRQYASKWKPNQSLDPERRAEGEFNPEHAAHYERALNENNKNGRAITGVEYRVIEIAMRTARGHSEPAPKQFADTATRTAAEEYVSHDAFLRCCHGRFLCSE